MLRFSIKKELSAGERVYMIHARNSFQQTVVRVMGQEEFTEDIYYKPAMTIDYLTDVYGDDDDGKEELPEIIGEFGEGALEHLMTGGTVWECSDSFKSMRGIGDCPYGSEYEATLALYQGEISVFDTIEEFINSNKYWAQMHSQDMSAYYECYDTEDFAADLIDVTANTLELRNLIIAAAPKDQIISVAKEIYNDLIERLNTEIDW